MLEYEIWIEIRQDRIIDINTQNLDRYRQNFRKEKDELEEEEEKKNEKR